jgi:hypothetical protein
VETPIVVAEITRGLMRNRVFGANEAPQKRSQQRKLTIFGNTKKVSQTTTKYFKIRFPSVPGLSPVHTFCTQLCLGPEAAGVSLPPLCGPGRPQTSISGFLAFRFLSLDSGLAWYNFVISNSQEAPGHPGRLAGISGHSSAFSENYSITPPSIRRLITNTHTPTARRVG